MNSNLKVGITGITILASIIGGYFLVKAINKKKNETKAKKAAEALQKIEDALPPELKETAEGYDPTSHVKQLADMIYGSNFYVYPDEVNAIIMPLSDARTKKLAEAYKTEKGIGLYENLVGEWGWYYGTSEGKLKRLGLT
tara:strand:+ start:18966 stop:19385 length:420 start_codon:yes stop_codon:yes gene_type:complete